MNDESFNPYHTWLGISPLEAAPTYYRLLGLTPFEPNLTVIENAADRQMSHLRSFQTGPRAAYAQQLLNEIAAIRAVLLNPMRKAAYDNEIDPLAVGLTPLPLLSVEQHPPMNLAQRAPLNAPSPKKNTGPKQTKQSIHPLAEIAKVTVGGVIGIFFAVLILSYFAGIDLLGWQKKPGSQLQPNTEGVIKTSEPKQPPPVLVLKPPAEKISLPLKITPEPTVKRDFTPNTTTPNTLAPPLSPTTTSQPPVATTPNPVNSTADISPQKPPVADQPNSSTGEVMAADPRVEWHNESYDNTLRKLSGNDWIQIQNKTQKTGDRLREISRTPEYVELFNLQSNEVWKVYATKLTFKKDEWLSNGYWKNMPPPNVTSNPNVTPEPAGPNLILDGGFGGTGSNWVATSYHKNPDIAEIVSSPQTSGNAAALIRTAVSNDARFFQKVAVKPNTRYRVSGWIKTENVMIVQPGGRVGACLSLESMNHSPSLIGNNDWTFASFDFDSGDKTEIEVGARLGHYGSGATGTAWFDDLVMIEISKNAPITNGPTITFDLRREWQSNSYPFSLRRVKDKDWIEFSDEKKTTTYELRETSRTRDYIELHNAAKKEVWRVYPDKMTLSNGTWLSNGHWKTISPKVSKATDSGNSQEDDKKEGDQPGPAQRPKDAVKFVGHWYMYIPMDASWDQAQRHCQKMGGYLACPETAAENVFIWKLIGNTEMVWLGGFKDGFEWKWVSGKRIVLNGWGKGEPNNAGGKENYLTTSRTAQGWNDSANKNVNVHGFVCEWD